MLFAGQISFTKSKEKTDKSWFQKSMGDSCIVSNYRFLELGWTLSEDSKRKGWGVHRTQQSFLLGKAFSKKTYLPLQLEDLPLTQEQLTHFIHNYWGDYLLIWVDFVSSKVYVLRSPSCPIPFFYTKISEEEWIFATSMACLSALIAKELKTNWNYMISSIQEDSLLGKATPFEAVYQLPLGCFLKLNEKHERVSVAWNPVEYVNNSQMLHPDDVGDLFMETMKRVLKCWCQDVDDIYLSFSGGVDSAVLHYAIHESLGKNQRYYPLHLYNENSTACDERTIAEYFSRTIHTPLKKINYFECLPYEDLAIPVKPNIPSMLYLEIKQDSLYLRQIKDEKKAQFINGHGGDNSLMSSPHASFLVDYICGKGVSGSLSYIKDLASVDRATFYQVLWGGFRGALSLVRGMQPTKDQYFFAPWLKTTPRKLLHRSGMHHPYFNKCHRTFPGKQVQINDVFEVLKLIGENIRAPGNYIFYPFLSQPVLELLLATPTHTLFHNAHDRYIARKAVSDRYGEKYIWRKDKGEFSSVYMWGLKQNHAQILELLMQGQFIRKGLVDPCLLKETIDEILAGDMRSEPYIRNLIAAEVFFKGWQ